MAITLRGIAVAAALTLLTGTAGVTQADVALGTTFNGVLYDIDTATGTTSNPRSTGIIGLDGITFRQDGVLFGLSQTGSTPAAKSLFQINPVTGASVLIGPTGIGNIVEGDIAANPTTGTLYGVQGINGTTSRDLFSINASTGAATIVGTVNDPGADFSSMAFTASGSLLLLDNNFDKLLTVDQSNANVLNTVSLSRHLGAISGMAFDPKTGILYVADGDNIITPNLYTLDPSTGVLTLIGPTNVPPNGISGLTFTPSSVPEPSPALLAGLAAVLGTCYRRFNRAA